MEKSNLRWLVVDSVFMFCFGGDDGFVFILKF